MRVAFAKDLKALLHGAEHLLVVAPARSLARFPKILDSALHETLVELRAGLDPGDLGAVATSLTGGRPARLTLGCLPDEVSRYNCAARPECVQRVASQAKLPAGKTSAVLCVLDRADHALPVANALARAFPLFSLATTKKARDGTLRILTVDRHGAPLPADTWVRAVVDGTREAARLVDTPPTALDPAALAREAKRLLGGSRNVRTQVIAGDALLKARLGGLHAVGRTAVAAPRLLVARYEGKRSKRHIALVGKGITYDTGGLSIKDKTAMPSMKSDMGGAAAALLAFRALVRGGCPHRLSLLLCLAENAVGPRSYKPDDVLAMHSGKSVEVNNTDAEGRLVLADGVSFAARVLKADTIIDAATLTGAQLVATGNLHAAVISNDAKLERIVVDAGHRSGDLVHPLMFAPELYKREFKSPIADMRNSVANRSNAQVSCAAQFIWWHIEDAGVSWAHVDLAGPAFQSDRGTGFGVALLAEVVRAL